MLNQPFQMTLKPVASFAQFAAQHGQLAQSFLDAAEIGVLGARQPFPVGQFIADGGQPDVPAQQLGAFLGSLDFGLQQRAPRRGQRLALLLQPAAQRLGLAELRLLFPLQTNGEFLAGFLPPLRLLPQIEFLEASAPLPGQRLALFDQRQPLFKAFQVFLLELEVGAALLQRHAQLRQLFGASADFQAVPDGVLPELFLGLQRGNRLLQGLDLPFGAGDAGLQFLLLEANRVAVEPGPFHHGRARGFAGQGLYSGRLFGIEPGDFPSQLFDGRPAFGQGLPSGILALAVLERIGGQGGQGQGILRQNRTQTSAGQQQNQQDQPYAPRVAKRGELRHGHGG